MIVNINKPTDSELVEAVADLWQAHGGDADGFEWMQRKIYYELDRRDAVLMAGEVENERTSDFV